MAETKCRDYKGMGPDAVRELNSKQERSGAKGLYGQYLNEGDRIPVWKKAGSENVIQGTNNSFIVLGRDRPGTASEGYGGLGCTGAGYIDLVVGLGGQDYIEYMDSIHKKKKRSATVTEKQTDPNMVLDAARIYITQKGDIDYYFGLAQGSERQGQSKNKSAVALKADHVRLVGREHIKIVTGKAQLQGGGNEKNSGEGDIDAPGQIDLIAGNYTDTNELSLLSIGGKAKGAESISKLQPLVKGSNLVDFLNIIIEIIEDMLDMHLSTATAITNLSTFAKTHIHPIIPFVGPALPSPMAAMTVAADKDAFKIIKNCTATTFNLGINKLNYLESFFPTFICSRHVNTT